jgi:Rrf2 family transcriptional regulator, iron-sulfur cluster assembly transcription factor
MRLEILPRTELTLRLLRTLADGARWRAVDLADEIGSSANSVARLIAPLGRAGWVHSVPGPTGGHELVADLDDVSVLDLITVVEGGPDDGRCVMADQPCPAPSPCALHDAWVPARDAMIEQLAATPISSLPTPTEVVS